MIGYRLESISGAFPLLISMRFWTRSLRRSSDRSARICDALDACSVLVHLDREGDFVGRKRGGGLRCHCWQTK